MWKLNFKFRANAAPAPDAASVFFERMEPKILFSADAFSGLVSNDPFSDSGAASAGLNIQQSASFLNEVYAPAANETDDPAVTTVTPTLELDALQAVIDGSDAPTSLDSLEALLDGAGTQEERREIIFVDAATPDYQQLLDTVNTDVPGTDYQIFILQSDRDGIEQISKILGGFEAVDAIHLVSHGNDTGVQLGSSWLGQKSLDQYADAISGWSKALTEDADLLIYGCNLAANASGQQLIDSLANLTTADIAASDDFTGAATLGGDWELEYNVGDIESVVALDTMAQQTWSNVLATFTVTTTSDVINAVDGLTSLREAIIDANNLAGADEIILGPGTYTLSIGGTGEDAALQGDLDINSNITITGAAAATTVIDGDGIDRVFHVANGNSLKMADLTVQGGDAGGSGSDGRGGGIFAEQNTSLMLDHVIVRNNTASGEGGGIYTRSSSMTLTDVAILNNGDASTDRGGGIFNVGQASTLDRVTVSGNQAGTGGGISNEGELLTLQNVTVSGNTATTNGGAIENVVDGLLVPGTLEITNSTFSGNTGGLVNGIYQDATSIVNLQNTILNDGGGSNISGGIVNSLGYNIDSDGSAGLGGAGDQVADPMLAALADNGGFTQTHALLAGSTAIDPAGLGGAPALDQRGSVRDATPDIGAYEYGVDLNGPTDLETVESANGSISINEDGGNDAYLLADDGGAIFGGLTSLTIETQFAVSTPAADETTLLSYASSGSAEEVKVIIRSTGQLELHVGGSSQVSAGTYASLFDGQQHHVAVSWDSAAGSVEMYVDGAPVESFSGFRSGYSVVGSGTLLFGQEQNSVGGGFETADLFQGRLYDLRIFDDVRTAGEILASYDATLPFNESGLVANWTFNDISTGGVVTDSVAGNHLTVQHVGTGGGFTTSNPVLTLVVDENSPNGTAVGTVAGTDAERDALIASLLGANPDLSYSAETGKFYEFVLSPLDFSAAQSNALGSTLNGVSGQMAIVESATENQLLADIVAGAGILEAYLGASDASVEGEWRWFSGITEDEQFWAGDWSGSNVGGLYINWSGGEPNNVAEEDYAAIRDVGSWNDVSATTLLSSIIEYDAGAVLGNAGPAGEQPLTYSIQAQAVAGAFAIDANSGQITVADGALLDYETDPTHTLTVRVTDVDGNTYDEAIAIELRDINDPPTATNLSSTSSYNEGDASVPITDIVVSDVDTGEIITATLTLADTATGSLSANDGASYTPGTGVWTITDTVANVNTALANLVFTPNVNNDVDTSIDVNIDDGDEDGSGALTGTITLDVIPLNDAPTISPPAPVFINELHYDNAGIDSGEAIELMGLAGTDLSGWSIVLYNGLDGLAYDTVALSGVIADQSDGYGTLVFNFPVNGIQNGDTAADGIALVNASSQVVQFISYEGTLSAGDGPAAGMTSSDIGVEEDFSTPAGYSLQFSGTGSEMTWTVATPNTFGGLNTGQSVYAIDSGIEDTDNVYSHAQMLLLLGARDSDDADVDLTVNISNVVNGSLTLSGGTGGFGTTFTFSPDPDFYGQLTFDYQVLDDDLAASAVGNGIINIAPVNDAPTATNLSSTSAYNEGDANVPITDIVVSDNDAGDIVTATLTLADTATGSLSANDGATYDGLTGIWTITDTVANVNTALANLVFNPALNNEADTTIGVNIDDGDEDGSGALTGTITLDVTPVNDPPTATNLSSTSAYNEGDASVPITDIVVSDIDAGEIISATLTLANTATGSLSANDGATYDGLTGIWAITDTAANVNTALANLVFNPALNNEADTTIGVSIDDGDEDASGPLTGTINLDVTPVNDPPTATNLSSTSAYGEGAPFVPITDIVVSDVDAGEIITATLTLADTATGSLSANDGATYDGLTGIWTLTDTVANVNTALANLVFNPALNNEVDTTIGVNIDDGDEDGSGALTGTITLDVTPVNDPPTATNLSSTSAYNEGDASVPITDIVVSDIDAGDIITATLTLADTATGSLSANDGATYDGLTGIWAITDTVANVNTALANLVFNPTVNNEVDTTVAVSIDDGDEDGSGALTGTITLDVTPVNDPPTATNLSSTSTYNEGDANVPITDIVVSDIDAGDIITATLTLADTATGSLSANDGATYDGLTGIWAITDTVANVNTALANLVFNPALNNEVDTTIGVNIDDGDEDGSGALTGTITLDVTPVNDPPTATNLSSTSTYNEGDANVPITDIVVSDIDAGEIISATLTLADTATGSLSANDGATYDGLTGIWAITDTVANVNTALANLVFNPALNNEVDTTIGVNIDDGDEDGSGALTGTITLDVTPVNDPPTATNLSSTSAYNEGDASVPITDIVVSDNDAGDIVTATLTLADTTTGSLSANDGATYNGLTGIWTITDTVANVNTALANLVFNPALNNEADTTIGVDIDDGDEDASGALTGTITLDVTPVNDAPTATNLTSTSSYNEGDASVPITDIVVSDIDAGDIVTATLTLADTATGSLSANDGATYDGLTGIWTITDTVANVNTALANLVFNPALNNEADTTIGVNIDDGDEDGSGALTGTITLDVTPVNDPPTATNLSSTSTYNEGDANVPITDIVVSDIDAGDIISATLTLADTATGSLSANDGATYDGLTGIWTITDTVANVNTALANLVFNPALNNEADTTIGVNIDDGDEDGSGALTGTITLDVTPVNDPPTATNLSSTSTYNEGDANVPITDIVVSDIDAGDIITATLTLADTATGSLSANDGATYDGLTGIWTLTDTVANVNTALANLVFNPTVNNEVDTTVAVSIDDGDEDGSGALTGIIDLDVTPVNDAPTASNLNSTSNYDEGDASVALNDIVVADVDSGETVTATLILADVDTGSLSANNGATYSATTGVWTITGTVAQVNTALANLEFIPVASNTLDTTIAISIDDGDEDASGPLIGAMTITVNPLPVVEPPVVEPPVVEPPVDEIPPDEPEVEDPVEEPVAEVPGVDPLAPDAEPVLIATSETPAPGLPSISAVEAEDPDVRDYDNNNENDKLREAKVLKPAGVDALISRLTEQLDFFDDPLQLIGAESFITRLNDMREELISETEDTEKIIGSSLSVTAGLSVGYVVWLARSGVLLSSVLSSLPAWRFIDPLPVLGGLQSGREDEEGESLESMVENKETETEDLEPAAGGRGDD